MSNRRAEFIFQALKQGLTPDQIVEAIRLSEVARKDADDLSFELVTARREPDLIHKLVTDTLKEQVAAGHGPQQLIVMLSIVVQNLAATLETFGRVAEHYGHDVDGQWAQAVAEARAEEMKENGN